MAEHPVCEDHRLEKGGARQAVRAVQPCARHLSDRVKTFDAGLTIEIDLDASAHVMSRGNHRDRLGGNVDAEL